MKFICTIIIVIISKNAVAQLEAANWFYGHNCGLTFTTNPPSALTGGQIYTNEGCSSASDGAGQLLFYSDGIKVWDRNHNIMPNGTGLHGHNSSSQSCLIVRKPGSFNLYYLFTAPDYSTSHGLEYSIIDMNLNNGFGDVTSVKNVSILSNSTEKIAAVLHANNTDIWIVGHKFESADFYSWLLTPAGLSSVPVISTSGTLHQSDSLIQYSDQNKIGCMKISPCGDKIACAVLFDSFLELHDFNDSTGVVSDPLLLGNWPGLFPFGIYGVEFSSGCTKLYASNESPAIVIQFDLTAGTNASIIASADTVCEGQFDYYGALQNGPDNKLYVSRLGNNHLGSITMPDEQGANCAYDAYYVNAGGSAVFGLPAFLSSLFINKETSTTELINNFQSPLFFPNPVNDVIHITDTMNFSSLHITISDLTGRKVYESFGERVFNISHLPKGMYFLNYHNNDVQKSARFIKN